MLKQILLVGLGGGIGSILRFLSSLLVNKFFDSYFPWATFIVNIVGCFLIGLLTALFMHPLASNNTYKLLFITGFCGGFTTFSTFATENLNLFQEQHSLLALLYIVLSVFIGISAVWLGLSLGKSYSL